MNNLKSLFVLLLLFPFTACMAVVNENKADLKPSVMIEGEYQGKMATYLSYNTEDYPCFKIKLGESGSKEFCSFTDEIGEVTDARKDVSAISYKNVKFTKDALKLVIDISARGPGRFFLDCTISFSDFVNSEPRCTFRDAEY
ncbi:hypothetical protein I6F65_21150 [Pseudoalteromonas sp. SWXJZ94C]|uniref:hypothetical protein n=1 Tax=unclassified Pseudoalteromonas TaxID=194690 RepID=UPI001408CB7C|nr:MULTISPECIES: hypothetical protein [unclassified Pseudoalteromonas]MBH0059443.1 hypothetical protein [Pseudoalteromonas sp. SWXJZ94C]